MVQLDYPETGSIIEASDHIDRMSFMLSNQISSFLDGATSTNQENLKLDLFGSDTAQYLEFMEYNAGTDLYECVDTSDTDDYYLDIYTTTSTGISALAINNCGTALIYSESGAYIYRMYCDTGTAEVQRAQVMKTLFYGTNGTDSKVQGITGLTNLKSSDARDVGKQAHYAAGSYTSGGNGSATYTGTIAGSADDCSVWSYATATGTSGTTQTVDEIGTDTSGEEQTNPATVQLYHHSTDSPDVSNVEIEFPDGTVVNSAQGTTGGGVLTSGSKSLVLCGGDITWVEVDAGGVLSVSNIDFLTDHSIPLIEAATITDDLTCSITTDSTTITTDETMAIVKALYTLTVGNTIAYEISFDDGSNWLSATESVLTKVTNTGTSFRVRMTITRATNDETDSITSYGAYYS